MGELRVELGSTLPQEVLVVHPGGPLCRGRKPLVALRATDIRSTMMHDEERSTIISLLLVPGQDTAGVPLTLKGRFRPRGITTLGMPGAAASLKTSTIVPSEARGFMTIAPSVTMMLRQWPAAATT